MLDTVPAPVRRVIEACWKGAPELRPSAAEVVEMLEEIEASGEYISSWVNRCFVGVSTTSD
jgi:hypothetical protein